MIAAAVGLSLAGCGGLALPETAVRPHVSHPDAIARPRKADAALAELKQAHEADPADAGAAIRYARGLRRAGHKAHALALLERHPAPSAAVYAELGLLALDTGQAAKAEQALARALDPKKPDWRVLNGLGTAQATLGRPGEAVVHLRKAHELAPTNESVMNNLALALILDRRVEEGEQILRRAADAAARPRIRQNLALALSLKGRHQEAVKVAGTSISEADARANDAFLKGLVEGKSPVKRAARVEPSAARAATFDDLRPTIGK